MTESVEKKVGIISCSGEACIEGTISRVATRLVLEKLRPNETVTICLPLFLAGGKEERSFAHDYPTITVDGCNKNCARIGTERYSGKPTASIVVTDTACNPDTVHSPRRLDDETMNIAKNVADKITKEVDNILTHRR